VILNVVVFVAVLFLRLSYISFTDDHFDRISKGRQILLGAVPFHDFFDPGFFLTLYSSSAVQVIFGDTLLGEVLLNSTFIALGFTLAFAMAREISASRWIALAVLTVGVLTLPRLYNFDKVLFFPLGLFLAWRYAMRPTRWHLTMLGVAAGIAGLYRYDSAVYIGLAAVVTVAAIHLRDRVRIAKDVVAYGLIVLATTLPAVLFVGLTGSVSDAARQMAEYGRREAERSKIFELPDIDIDRSAPLLVRGEPMNVRWRDNLDDDDRTDAERLYGLQDGVREGGRTWRYRLVDSSDSNVEAMRLDPRVEDTHGIARSGMGRDLLPAIILLPGVLTLKNAAAWLAWVLLALPVVTIVVLISNLRSGFHEERRTAMLLAAATLCLSADLMLLRDPLEARIGDVAAPALPLAAWLITWVFRGHRARRSWRGARLVAAFTVIVTVVAIGRFAAPALAAPPSIAWSRFTASPPSPALLPSGRTLGVVDYVRACTSPDDRVLLAWFAPEVFFFSGRGFAGGMSVYFGGHWSNAADQRRTIARLQRERAPVAVISLNDYPSFASQYALIDQFLNTNYEVAGQASLGDPEGEYRILFRRGAVPAGTFSGLPCLR
jgi:hypothetical protein